jgi:hypothetical protein
MQRHLLLKDCDRVVTYDAQIGEFPRLDPKEEAPDARAMHFDAQVVALWMRRGKRRQMIAVAKADFEDTGRLSAEEGVKVEGLRLESDAVLWP